MSGSARGALPDVREWSGGPPKKSGSGREALPGSRNASRCPGVVGMPFLMSGSGQEAQRMSGSDIEALPDVRE